MGPILPTVPKCSRIQRNGGGCRCSMQMELKLTACPLFEKKKKEQKLRPGYSGPVRKRIRQFQGATAYNSPLDYQTKSAGV